ncbi:MAG: DNA alkylation repair protein [Prevotellaceae bacterium]|jgi:3-methyladenine DNA glycosylase AlkD|nr:DNA alkylation repair protein [Prevotellaceae bacterium]
MTTAIEIKEALFALSDPVKKAFLPHFFKTGKGQYGEGDLFIGVVVPRLRALVKQFDMPSMEEIDKLLADPYHECRLTGLLFLIKMYASTHSETLRQSVYDFYLAHYTCINNWDLVDLSAPQIVGEHLLTRNRTVLRTLATDNHLWLQRIAIVSTFTFIKHNQLDDTYTLADILLLHQHDLIHKAVGWMLREAGKRSFESEYTFLTTNDRYKMMPRTMLRYAIERFDEPMRQDFLKGRI